MLLIYMGNLVSLNSFINDYDNQLTPRKRKNKSLKRKKSSPDLQTETDIFGVTRVVKNKVSTGSSDVGLYLTGGKKRKTKKNLKKIHSKKRKSKKRVQRGGRWYDTTPEETRNINMTPLGYSAIRDIAFDKKYYFNPPQQGGSRKNKIGRGVQFKRLVRYSNDLPNN